MINDLGLGIVVSMKDAFTQNALRIQSAMTNLDESVAKSSERMNRNLGRIEKGTMMVGAGIALMGIPTALLVSTAATQKALGELSSVGVKDMQALENAAEDFSNTWAGATKAEFIGAAYDVKSALANLSDEAIGIFSAMAALTGKATKATTQEMVGAFTTAYGIFKPIMADMSDIEWAKTFSGALAQTVAAFKTTGPQMADAIKNVGATAAASKIPLQEQMAILGQLQTTMPGAEAGTLYKSFIMKAAEAGNELGLQFTDAEGRLKGVIPILQEIQSRFPDLSQAAAQVQIKKAFGSDEAVKFVLQMSAGMEALQGNIETIGQAMQKGTSITEQMANAMNQDIGTQFVLLRQQITNLSEILGRALIPVVAPIIQGISKVILSLQKIAKSIPGVTRVVLAFSLALGTILVITGSVVAGIGLIGVMLPALQVGFLAIGSVIAGVGSLIATWFLPVVGIIAGVIISVMLLRSIWNSNFAGIKETVLLFWNNVKLVFSGITSLMKSLSSGVGEMSAETAQKLEKAGLLSFVIRLFQTFYRVREFLSGFWSSLSKGIGSIRSILEPSVVSLLSAFGSLGRALLGFLKLFGLVKANVDASNFRSFGVILGTVIGILVKASVYIVKFLFYPFILTVEAITGVIRAITFLGRLSVTVMNFIGSTIIQSFITPFKVLIDIIAFVGQKISALWNSFVNGQSLLSIIETIGNGIVNFLVNPFEIVFLASLQLFSSLHNMFFSFQGILANFGSSIYSWFTNLQLIELFQQQLTNIISIVSGNGTALFEAGRKLLITLGEGIRAAAMYPVSAIKEILNKIRNFLPFSDAKEGPLSALTSSGAALSSTFAEGMSDKQEIPSTAFTTIAKSIQLQIQKLRKNFKSEMDALDVNPIFAVSSTQIPERSDNLTFAAKSVVTQPSMQDKEYAIDKGAKVPLTPPDGGLLEKLNVSQKINDIGVLNIIPKILSNFIPPIFTSALLLNPALSDTIPSITKTIDVVPENNQVYNTTHSQYVPLDNKSMNPFVPVPKQAEGKPDEMVQNERKFQPVIRQQGHNQNETGSSQLREIFNELFERIKNLESRPIDIQVKTHIDGRQVAETVYKDLRERRVRNYETL